MTPDEIVVTATGLVVVGFVAWYFWGPRGEGLRVALTSAGRQEAMVLVKGGYTPDVLVVEHGKPVRLIFRREETAASSEMVLLPDFERSAKLPAGEEVPIDLLPEKPGEYEFACQMGMLRGKLVVK